MWMAIASMWQPVQAAKKLSSQPVPMDGGAPFVTAGETSLALPAKGSMYCFQAAAAAAGLKLDCAPKSGSLNLSC